MQTGNGLVRRTRVGVAGPARAPRTTPRTGSRQGGTRFVERAMLTAGYGMSARPPGGPWSGGIGSRRDTVR